MCPQRRVSLADGLKGARGYIIIRGGRNVDRRQSRITSGVRIRYEPLLTSLFFAASMNSARLFDTNGSRGKRWREFPRQSREEERLDPSRSNGTCDLIVVREIEVAARPSYHFCLFSRSYLSLLFLISTFIRKISIPRS